MKEETGLDDPGPLDFLGVYGDPGRDPRGRTISMTYVVVLPGPPPPIAGSDDATEASWLDPFTVEHLAFDHDLILKNARSRFIDSKQS